MHMCTNCSAVVLQAWDGECAAAEALCIVSKVHLLGKRYESAFKPYKFVNALAQALPGWPNVLSTGTRPQPANGQALANGSASQSAAEAMAPPKAGECPMSLPC